MSENDEVVRIKEYARQNIRAAFDDRDAIIELVSDSIYDEDLEEELSAEKLVDEEIAALHSEQKDWPEVTDTDRLERVFEALLKQGIVPRHNFTCCGTCGLAEIDDEIDLEAGKGTDVKGYVFYHMQDTESAVEGRGLYFYYGSIKEKATKDDHLAVGEMLASVSKDNGLVVDWDNSLDTRVWLKLDWKRRWGSSSRFVQGG